MLDLTLLSQEWSAGVSNSEEYDHNMGFMVMLYYSRSQFFGTRTMESSYFRGLQGKKQCPQWSHTSVTAREKKR